MWNSHFGFVVSARPEEAVHYRGKLQPDEDQSILCGAGEATVDRVTFEYQMKHGANVQN